MKYTFVLKNINIADIDSKYNFRFKSNISNATHKENTTCISELNDSDHNKSYSFLDDSKKKKKCTLTMNNHLGKKLPHKTNIHCYWCKHSFTCPPIGCPIKHTKNDTYITDGIFCSFNCCLSYINDNKHKSLYEYSLNYLMNMHSIIFKTDVFIKLAPNWRLLKMFGGNKNIEDYRKSFDSVVYKPNDNYIITFPDQLPIGWIYEEQLFI